MPRASRSIDVEVELRRCASDFRYFCRFLKIVDKKTKVVSLKLNAAQEVLIASIERNPWVFDLKARQMGGTTGIAAYAFWHAYFRPNFRVGVMAQSRESAEQIFEIYKRFYDNMPEWLQFPTEKSNVREMLFFHGGMVRVFTANTQSARGTTYNFLHCSEFAFYSDVEQTVRAVFQTATPDAVVVMETTANGLNHAHRLWVDNNGYEKVFLPWTLSEEYTLDLRPAGFKTRHEKWREYGKEHKLSSKQLWWAYDTYRTKCGNNWQTFHQEYPITAEVAFITSGERYFDTIYPHAKAIPGYKEYATPHKYHVYSMGVDTASGSPSGDFSTFCVLDITNKDKPKCVSTFYARLSPSDFSERVLKEAKRWDALVVAEANSYGLSIIEHLIGEGYANLYRRTKFDKMAKRWREELGFMTTVATRPVLLSGLHKAVSSDSLQINDERMKAEMNTFVYAKSGKPQADSGKHDDMVFAWALALAGVDQIDVVKEEKMSRRPTTLREMLAYEHATGKVFEEEWVDGERDSLDILSQEPLVHKRVTSAKIPRR
jgi:hypothetical protein